MANARRAASGRSLPVATIAHASPGRTRLRLPAERDAPEALATLGAALARLAPVEAVEVRPFTGSLLVHHAGDFGEIARLALAEGLFEIEGAPPRGQRSEPRLAGGLASLTALAFTGLGVMQLFQNRVLPPALTLFWYAASLAREARDAEAAAHDE